MPGVSSSILGSPGITQSLGSRRPRSTKGNDRSCGYAVMPLFLLAADDYLFLIGGQPMGTKAIDVSWISSCLLLLSAGRRVNIIVAGRLIEEREKKIKEETSMIELVDRRREEQRQLADRLNRSSISSLIFVLPLSKRNPDGRTRKEEI